MDWVKLELHRSGQYMLDALCSRLSHDIHQFNGLPESVRWVVGLEPKVYELHRYDRKEHADVIWVPKRLRRISGQAVREKLVSLKASETDVKVSFHEHMRVSLTIKLIPRTKQWETDIGGLKKEVFSDVWEVSQFILKDYLFPPASC